MQDLVCWTVDLSLIPMPVRLVFQCFEGEGVESFRMLKQEHVRFLILLSNLTLSMQCRSQCFFSTDRLVSPSTIRSVLQYRFLSLLEPLDLSAEGWMMSVAQYCLPNCFLVECYFFSIVRGEPQGRRRLSQTRIWFLSLCSSAMLVQSFDFIKQNILGSFAEQRRKHQQITQKGRNEREKTMFVLTSFICGKNMNACSLHFLNLPLKPLYHLPILFPGPYPALYMIYPCISVYNSNQMLQNRSQFQSNQEASLLSSQLKQYRKINSNLRKKIKQKDNQIQQLFGYIQDVGLAFSNTQGYLIKGQINQQRSHKLALSDNRKREKENKASEFFQESNIFKQPSYSLMTRNSRPEVHLPVLDKKNKNIFQDQVENPDKRTKVIRISLEKLKPLNPEEVKKRFLMKYQRHEANE